ncbi:unnamed protein product [Soboliphyme baturini]|uniref:Reverse transcriptase domain-containing protein n=1 Tax=Soboliphyme baturini TaxID=241478 RepID=A0A183J835_9BILA|nr:unnamed protein product [Soboliphyme baturini]
MSPDDEPNNQRDEQVTNMDVRQPFSRSRSNTIVSADVQNGYHWLEGCYEHIFTCMTLLKHAQHTKGGLHIGWLDIRDAFGSVSHQLLTHILKEIGPSPEQALGVFRDMYEDVSFAVDTDGASTGEIPLKAGG